MNPMQLISMVRNGGNPQQFVMNMVQQQMGNTPMGQNVMQMIQNGDGAGIEKVARNLCTQQGLDFDKEFQNFKHTLGL